MRARLMTALALTLSGTLAACNPVERVQARHALEDAERARATNIDWNSYEATIGHWSIKCSGGKLDNYGERRAAKRCSAQYFSPKEPLYGTSTVLKVNASGPVVTRARKKNPLCRSVAKRIAVDGQRIDGLNNSAQIRALLVGSQFAREDHGLWPGCGIINSVTRLERTQEAYDTMMDLWLKFSGRD